MRKDVKIGLGIGGVLLAVLIVYLLVPKTNDNALVQDDGIARTSDEGGAGIGAGAQHAQQETTPSQSAGTGASTEVSNQGAIPAPDHVASQPQSPAETGGERDPAQSAKVDWETMLATGIVPEEAKIGLVAPNTPPEDIFADKSPTAGKSGANDTINWNQPVGSSPQQPKTAAPATPTSPSQPPAVTGGSNGGTRGGLKDHVVQQGENLSMIASVAYGDAKHYREILKANPNLDERKMRPGTVIKMPDPSTFAQPKAQQAVARQEASVDATTQYRVQQGDSLHKIALKLYGKATKADALYEANKDKIGDDSSRLKLGMILKLPEAPTVAQSSR
jgi:phage tail protein X